MKILQTGDLHLGKILYEYSLIEDQKHILNEIKNTIKKDAAIDHVLASIYQKIVLKLGQSNVLEGNDKTKKYVFFIGLKQI